jgi:hypothetical protein
MVCKLAQIQPEIWITLPLEAKKWPLNERKLQQQEDEKINKSLALSKSIAVYNYKEISNSNMPNQYASVKNVAKGKDVNVIKDNSSQTYVFVDDFLEEAIKISSTYETGEDAHYEYFSSNHNAHSTLRISNSLHNKCMNQLHLSEKYQISILDCGTDTCVLG